MQVVRMAGRLALVLVQLLMVAAIGCGGTTTKPKKRELPNGPDWLMHQYEAPPPGADKPKGRRVADDQGDESEDEEDFAGRKQYYEAREAIQAGDLRTAIRRLHEVTRLSPDGAEGWYQLGAAQSNLAVETVNVNEGEAISLFHDGVDSKRRAKELMDEGSYYVWTEDEQAQAESDIEQGLDGVDELLANDELLLQALHIHASMR